MSDSQGGYIRRVQEDTRRYVEQLLKENEALRAQLSRVERERLVLEKDLSNAREEMERYRDEQRRLERQLAEVEAGSRKFTKEYLEIEQRTANLANLYVASYRLHGSLDRADVLAVIQEILINLVGSEEIAVFERNGDLLTLASAFGIDEKRYQRVGFGEGIIGRVAVSGEPFFADGDADAEENITACVPLRVAGRVTGVVAVFRMLPQKPRLGDVDHELFDLLGTHAAMALYCARLHAESAVSAEAN